MYQGLFYKIYIKYIFIFCLYIYICFMHTYVCIYIHLALNKHLMLNEYTFKCIRIYLFNIQSLILTPNLHDYFYNHHFTEEEIKELKCLVACSWSDVKEVELGFEAWPALSQDADGCPESLRLG